MSAEELIAALAQLEWSQAELARRLEVDRDTVNRWARGHVAVPGYAKEYLRVMTLAKGIFDATDRR